MLFDVADQVRATVVFRNSSELATDPTTIVVTVNGPGTNILNYTYGIGPNIVRDTTGTYHVDFTCTDNGRWWVTWNGTGTLTASAVLNFLVDQGA